jgi:hypothetical protein
MKAKHKYILTLSTLSLFVISVFIGYFISTAVVTKAPQADGGGGGCPDKSCTDDKDCWDTICNNMHGVCSKGKCVWRKCKNTTQCVDSYCCDKDTGNYQGNCFTEIYTDSKYLCAPE